MTDNIHIGDQVTQHGDYNIGIVKNNQPTDPRSQLKEMVALIHALRSSVPPADREVIDESMEVIGKGDAADQGTLRRALQNVAGIAAVVGQVGVPVINAINKVMTAFGL